MKRARSRHAMTGRHSTWAASENVLDRITMTKTAGLSLQVSRDQRRGLPKSLLAHPFYAHLYQPLRDVCRVESHATPNSKRGYRPALGASQNRQSRDL